MHTTCFPKNETYWNIMKQHDNTLSPSPTSILASRSDVKRPQAQIEFLKIASRNQSHVRLRRMDRIAIHHIGLNGLNQKQHQDLANWCGFCSIFGLKEYVWITAIKILQMSPKISSSHNLTFDSMQAHPKENEATQWLTWMCQVAVSKYAKILATGVVEPVPSESDIAAQRPNDYCNQSQPKTTKHKKEFLQAEMWLTDNV